MFGFGGSGEKTPKGDVFDIDEIRELVLDFAPPDESSSPADGLIALASGDGYTSRDALSKAYAELIKGRYGKIPIEALEKQLDVERTVICNVLKSRDDFMVTACKGFILTKCEQERILEEIYTRAKSKFIRAGELAKEHDIDIQAVAKLIVISELSSHESPLQLLDAPGQSRAKSLESGNSWVHTLGTLLALRDMARNDAISAHTGERVAEWKLGDMFGLDPQTFSRIAHKLCQDFNGKEPLYGFFESGKDSVRYVTKSYLLRKAKRNLKVVAMGEEAYIDLQQLVLKYPTLLPNVEAAKQLALTEVLHKDGQKYKWHFIQHYAIGDVGLNNTSKICMETLGPQRYLNTEPYVRAFPEDIRDDVLILLQNRIVEFWRYCGGEVKKVLGLKEWMVLTSIVDDIDSAAKRIARSCADDASKRHVPEPSLSDKTERKLYLEKLQEESDLPLELLRRLWDDDRVKIKSIGIASFDERLAELKAESRTQLESTWKTRCYIPARLHGDALENLEPANLNNQLEELLTIHLSQDLVPNTLKRLRTKDLLRESLHRKQVDKLETTLAAKKKDVSVMKTLDKFHEKMGFKALSTIELAKAREQQLVSMINSMKDDTDAPRLFLTTIIVLLASKNSVGIVHATGKFAPKLLKLLKPQLDEELYKSLERLKDAVKAGSITDDDRTEIRKLAAATLETSTEEDDEDDGTVTEKED